MINPFKTQLPPHSFRPATKEECLSLGDNEIIAEMPLVEGVMPDPSKEDKPKPMSDVDKSFGRQAVALWMGEWYTKFISLQDIDRLMRDINYTVPANLNNDFGDVKKIYVALLEALLRNTQEEIDRVEQGGES